MSCPLYYLPRVMLSGLLAGGKLNHSLLAARGLAASLADCASLDDLCRCEVPGNGPDGGPGIILSPLPVAGREPPRRIGFYANDQQQQWTRINDGLWVALDLAFPPTPADLARKDRHAGHHLLLGDGNDWEVPILRQPSGAPTLPRDMYWDEEGQFTLALRGQYAALWAQTEKLAGFFFDGGEGLRFEDGLKFALEVLALNYRVGAIEQRLLHLVTTENLHALLWMTVDGPWWDEAFAKLQDAQKKTDRGIPEPPTPSYPPGSPAAT